jgi:hypothetical protein
MGVASSREKSARETILLDACLARFASCSLRSNITALDIRRQTWRYSYTRNDYGYPSQKGGHGGISCGSAYGVIL